MFASLDFTAYLLDLMHLLGMVAFERDYPRFVTTNTKLGNILTLG